MQGFGKHAFAADCERVAVQLVFGFKLQFKVAGAIRAEQMGFDGQCAAALLEKGLGDEPADEIQRLDHVGLARAVGTDDRQQLAQLAVGGGRGKAALGAAGARIQDERDFAFVGEGEKVGEAQGVDQFVTRMFSTVCC
ncbi:hypothetical protein SDC9_171849 [bioreactor metagenome]|uniref:Uncharacterized protein n=1 Tax=bioreactor metagenome TaxID=1076179 RepID=A0A645GED4_9ZZZZ